MPLPGDQESAESPVRGLLMSPLPQSSTNPCITQPKALTQPSLQRLLQLCHPFPAPQEQNVPNEQCLAKNMFRFKGKGNKPNVSLELSSGNHRRSDTGFSLLSSLMFPLDSKSLKILK